MLLAVVLAAAFGAVTVWNALERQSGWHPAPFGAWPVRDELGHAGPAIIERVQSGLARLDYYPGSIDGQAGPQTRSAIRRFRRTRGLAPGEHIDDNLLAALTEAQSGTRR